MFLLGQSCGSQTCSADQFCNSPKGGPAPSCAAKKANGEACEDDPQCISDVCGDLVQQSWSGGIYFVRQNLICKDPPNGQCKIDSQCSQGETCQIPGNDRFGTCVASG